MYWWFVYFMFWSSVPGVTARTSFPLEVASWPLFVMAVGFPIGSKIKLLKWLQENIENPLMLNKRRRFHLSRVKLPLVSMSASWFLVSTCLILDLVLNWFCRTTNQAQLCGFWTHLIVGFRPLIIILITASLSSQMYNWYSLWEECVFVVA